MALAEKDLPAYFQGEEIWIVAADKSTVEKQVKEEVQPDGDKVRTEKQVIETPRQKETQTKTIEVEDSTINNGHVATPQHHFDFSWLLWAAIIGSVIFFVWRFARVRTRDREDRR
jgi:hypothetical protein